MRWASLPVAGPSMSCFSASAAGLGGMILSHFRYRKFDIGVVLIGFLGGVVASRCRRGDVHHGGGGERLDRRFYRSVGRDRDRSAASRGRPGRRHRRPRRRRGVGNDRRRPIFLPQPASIATRRKFRNRMADAIPPLADHRNHRHRGHVRAFSAVLFITFKKTVGIRSRDADEFDGLDLAEHDIGAYPDFQQNTIKSYHLREA